MMELLFDIGNTTVDWAYKKENEFTDSGKFKCDINNFVNNLEQNIQISKAPTAVLVSSVAANEFLTALQDWVSTRWQLEIWQAVVSSSFNELENSYPDPQQMGIDRWLAMIAAWEKYKDALCIVDCGTALTIDLIGQSGKHLGGYIVPGIQLMQQVLIENADKIKVTALNDASIAYANNTRDAINNGACLAIVAMIDHTVETMRDELNIEPKCIITGGMAKQIKMLLRSSFEYEQDLILRGLSIMYESCQ